MGHSHMTILYLSFHAIVELFSEVAVSFYHLREGERSGERVVVGIEKKN